MRVLVIDDEPAFLVFVRAALEAAGIDYVAAESAEEGLALLGERTHGTFDLVLLDIGLPGKSGWDVLMEVRERGDEVPVIFVTSRTPLAERVRGLELGADDYVVKPVEFDELIARMHAVLRRRRALTPIDYGDVHIDLARRRVRRTGHDVSLTPREYDLLLALVQADGAVCTREDLLRVVWDLEFNPGTNAVDVHIGRLRKKIDRHGRMAIETVWGEGYRIVRHEPKGA
jgi:DNA-binding response OmpR family regulator